MERHGEYDFIIFGQPWLLARSLRAVIRQDPSVIRCTAHKIHEASWRIHIEAASPLDVLQRALQSIREIFIAAGLAGKTHNALQAASHH